MTQVHKANQHSKRAGNLWRNRAHKRALHVHVQGPNRADRRLPLRLAHAADVAAKAAEKARKAELAAAIPTHPVFAALSPEARATIASNMEPPQS